MIEVAPRLMPRQLDDSAGGLLRERIEALGVTVHAGKAPRELLGAEAVSGVLFADGSTLTADIVIISAGIRPRDELARAGELGLD